MMRRSYDLGARFLVVYFILIGVSICGFWITQLSSGYQPQPSGMVIETDFSTWHIIADMLAGIMAVISAFLLLGRNPIGFRLSFFTCGLLLYTGLSSVGWANGYDPGLFVLFVIILIGAIFGFFYLFSKEEI